jgi:DNA-directed RNA polymerase subunit RPC12/RpoP
MPKCVDCGEEILVEDKYCPYCGSPTLVKVPDEAGLRRKTYPLESVQSKRRMSWIVIIVFLLIIMLIFVIYLSKVVSTQLGKIGTGFY